ncbi:MAG: 30S ribosomal protein S20 [Candidatus Marinimicrobia bacterium]|nr:30S ribosomal protein S20 [Candidatus Neomarinimicrobiota bacterium]
MDRHASTIKRHRQSVIRKDRNKAAKTRIRSLIRKVHEADTPEEAQNALQLAAKSLDKAAQKKLTHKNKTARLKSRLNRMISLRFGS